MNGWTLVWLVAIAHVWSRGTLFARARTLGIQKDPRLTAARSTWRAHPNDQTMPRLQAAYDDTRIGSVLVVWRALAGCALCSGFWIGVLGYWLSQYHAEALRLLGIGSLVGTLSLTVCALIRRL